VVLKVLIVDDDEDTRILLSEDLRDLGFESVWATDGATAVQAARRERPGLIILDYRLPAGDGLTVLRRLKQNSETASIPVILFSRQHSPQVIEEAINAGAECYVQKSFANAKLRSEVVRILGEATAAPLSSTINPLRLAPSAVSTADPTAA
jgi:CheY-like chemotaxis protein